MARGAELAAVGWIEPSIRRVAQLDDVMQFGRWRDFSTLVAVGTQRVGFQERKTKPAPRVVIASVVRCAAVSIIRLRGCACVTLRGLMDGRTGWHLSNITNTVLDELPKPELPPGPCRVTFRWLPLTTDEFPDGLNFTLNVKAETGDFRGIIRMVREAEGVFLPLGNTGRYHFMPWPPHSIEIAPVKE